VAVIVIINVIHFIARVLTLVVLVDVVLSYFMSPYSTVRMTLDRIVGPILAPIRRFVPPIGGTIDISPIILLILIQIIEYVLVQIIAGLF
jgi:YggT family protein